MLCSCSVVNLNVCKIVQRLTTYIEMCCNFVELHSILLSTENAAPARPAALEGTTQQVMFL